MEQPPYQHQPGPGYQPPPQQSGSDVVQTIIPYRNTPALIGYYLGVFSLIPCLGAVLGPAAVVLGIKGWQVGKQNPEFHGKAHAVVAMVLGGITTLAHLVVLVLILLGALWSRGPGPR